MVLVLANVLFNGHVKFYGQSITLFHCVRRNIIAWLGDKTTTHPMSTASCSVCQNATSKYHCPSCRATRSVFQCTLNLHSLSLTRYWKSCSLLCFKTHKNQCEHVSNETPITDPVQPPQPDTTIAQDTLLGDILTQDPRLQAIFEQYPNLRPKLKYIFDTAIANDNDGGRLVREGRGQKSQNSPEKRMARALHILSSQLDSETAETSGIKAFADLVAELRPGNSDPAQGHANPIS